MAKFLLLTILLINSLFSNETYIKNENSIQNLSSKENDETNIDELENEVIVDGLKSTLRKGVAFAEQKLNNTNEYLNSNAKIPLPPQLSKAENIVRSMGGDEIVDNLIYALNDTASKTIPKITPIFNKAIDEINPEDAKQMLSSQEDSATLYFKNKTQDSLVKIIKPIIKENMQQNKTTQYYKNLNVAYKKQINSINKDKELSNFVKNLGFESYIKQNPEIDLEEFLTQATIEGLFFYMATKEAQLKSNPNEDMENKIKKIFGEEK